MLPFVKEAAIVWALMEPWKKVDSELVFDKYRSVERRRFVLPNGKESDFYVQVSPRSSVCVLALTSKNEVILAKQFRAGPEAVLSEMPGGGMHSDEKPEVAAARELLEETGYSGEFQFVARCLVCAYSNDDRHYFVATNCVKTAEQKLDPNEFVEVETMPLADFRKYLRTGRMTDVPGAYLGLDYLGLL